MLIEWYRKAIMKSLWIFLMKLSQFCCNLEVSWLSEDWELFWIKHPLRHHDREDRRGVGGQPGRPEDVPPGKLSCMLPQLSCKLSTSPGPRQRAGHGAPAPAEELLQAAAETESDLQVQLQRISLRVSSLLRHSGGAREGAEQRKWWEALFIIIYRGLIETLQWLN